VTEHDDEVIIETIGENRKGRKINRYASKQTSWNLPDEQQDKCVFEMCNC